MGQPRSLSDLKKRLFDIRWRDSGVFSGMLVEFFHMPESVQSEIRVAAETIVGDGGAQEDEWDAVNFLIETFWPTKPPEERGTT